MNSVIAMRKKRIGNTLVLRAVFSGHSTVSLTDQVNGIRRVKRTKGSSRVTDKYSPSSQMCIVNKKNETLSNALPALLLAGESTAKGGSR